MGGRRYSAERTSHKPRRRRAHKDLKFTFGKNDQIGAADAQTDRTFLKDCFVDTGDLDLLLNLRDHRRIILGRTGSGKSALLDELSSRKGAHVIEVQPDNLALTFVSNSTILSFFSELGVNLDPFFKLLWRHVFTVEVLRHHFRDHVSPTQSRNRSILGWLDSLVGGQTREDKEVEESIEYLRNWGESFWKETEFRVREITRKFESELKKELKAQLGYDVARLSGATGKDQYISAEERAEILERAQLVVSKAQVHDLRNVIPLLSTVLADRQKAYYITIDGLDEDWVEERIRYRLIKALLFTLKEMSRIRNVKIIISLRRDLLERVFRLTRGPGFQEEKYQSLYLTLDWRKEDLLQILDKRVERFIHNRTGRPGIGFREFLPPKVDGHDIGDYIVTRARRPRDIIAFFNTCMAAAIGFPRVRVSSLRVAEGEYSRSRLRALADEWVGDYPNILEFSRILQRRPPSFKMATVPLDKIENLCLEIACDFPSGAGLLNQLARSVVENITSLADCRLRLFLIFYKVGLVGLKPIAFEGESWVDELGRGLSAADIDESSSVVVHPAYYRALGIQAR